MRPDRSGRARPRPRGPRRSRAAARAARAKPAPEEVDRGSGPPAGSSADAGEPGRLAAPVRAGQDRIDRVAGELAPSAARRTGYVGEAEATPAADPVPSKPVSGAPGFPAPGPTLAPVPEPTSPGSGSPPGTTGASTAATGSSTGPSGRTTGPVTGLTTSATRPTGRPTTSAARSSVAVRVRVAGLAAVAAERAAERAGAVIALVGGATRRTGEVTAGAPRLTVEATRRRAAPGAGRRGGATAWRAASAVPPTVEDPDPAARPANESTSLAVAFKVVPTGSRSGSRRSAASAGRDDRSRRRPAQNAQQDEAHQEPAPAGRRLRVLHPVQARPPPEVATTLRELRHGEW